MCFIAHSCSRKLLILGEISIHFLFNSGFQPVYGDKLHGATCVTFKDTVQLLHFKQQQNVVNTNKNYKMHFCLFPNIISLF